MLLRESYRNRSTLRTDLPGPLYVAFAQPAQFPTALTADYVGRLMKRVVICCITLITLLSTSTVSYGQTVNSQQISGTVKDQSGSVVANATITVTNIGTGLVKTVKSNSDGNYIVLDIPIGTYSITATSPGFKKFVVNGIIVEVAGAASIPVTLQVGQDTQTITVDANPVEVQTTTPVVGAVITSSEATQIQLNGRNYIQLVQLTPGVSVNVASGFDLFGAYGVNGSSQSIDGTRTDTYNFFIDGVDNKDNGGGGNNFVNISPDALEEYRDSASAFDASYGGSSGASVSVAIRNGTKTFHGEGYEFIRNAAIQAFAYQPVGTVTPIKPPLVYNDFGWQLGGPIYIPGHFNTDKSKLFFFGGQEFKRLSTGAVTTTAVPSPQQKSGNFSSYPPSEWPINPVTNQPFPNGIVPACTSSLTTGCATANGQALMNLFPNPNAGTNYDFDENNVLDTQEYLIKIDYYLNDKNQISGHWVHDNYTEPFSAGGGLIQFTRLIPGLTSSLQWTRTINSNTVNTLTGSWSGNIISETNDIRPSSFFPELASITRAGNGLTYPTLYDASTDIPSVTTTGFTELSATAINFNNYQRIYALKDDFSKIIRNSNLRLGAYLWRGRKNQTSIPAINGSFGFTGNTGQSGQLSTNQALANELLGNFATYQEGNAIEQIWARFTQMEFYVQDDWKLSRRFTLNLGFRWQYMEPIYSAINNASSFLPQYYSQQDAAMVNAAGIITSNPFPYNGMVLGGNGFPSQATGRVPFITNPQVLALFHNLNRGLMDTFWNASAPRLGFAYDLTGRERTVLRGGFGLSYERIEGNYIYGAVAQLPFVAVSNVNEGNIDSIASAAPAAANPVSIGTSHALNVDPPRVKNWSVGIQQQLAADTIAELDYVGTSSANLTWAPNLNQLPSGTTQVNPTVAANALRPYLGYQDIIQMENGAIFNYHSLQAQVVKRMQRGGTVRIAYTWSKNLTDSNSYNATPQNSFDLRGDYGPTNYNQPQIFVASYVYPLPFWQTGTLWYKQALGKWQLSGITRIASGLPLNVLQAANTDQSGDGITSVQERPNLVGNPFAGTGGKLYLNPSAFALPAAGTFGDLQSYGIKGPHYDNWDISVQKTFQIHGPVALDFRAEMFNFPNHLSAFTVDTTTTDSSFGDVTGTTDPRTVEFALKAHF